ncbi:MAG: PaaI family thioesterase [bacterium]|nr:PaaI family thioesterase [bacterium]
MTGMESLGPLDRLDLHPHDAPPPASPSGNWLALPKHGRCFVCQTDVPGTWQIDLRRDGSTVRFLTTLGDAQQGPPGHAHGGSMAALLDEAMGAAAWLRRTHLVAARLELQFRKPVPLGTEVMVVAWVKQEGRRSLHAGGALVLPDGTTAVEAHGVFAHAPALFEHLGSEFDRYRPVTDEASSSAP